MLQKIVVSQIVTVVVTCNANQFKLLYKVSVILDENLHVNWDLERKILQCHLVMAHDLVFQVELNELWRWNIYSHAGLACASS